MKLLLLVGIFQISVYLKRETSISGLISIKGQNRIIQMRSGYLLFTYDRFSRTDDHHDYTADAVEVDLIVIK